MILLSQTNFTQTESLRYHAVSRSNPLFSGLNTLSIHVRDTITHDSVFHFLVDKLKLPVYYYPAKSWNRKYAGVYAGNLILEPCGPYSNFSYATNSFRAIFFGLTFEPFESLSVTAKGLTDRKINHTEGDTYIYLHKDSALCGENITISFIEKSNINDKRKIDSLRNAVTTDLKNELGLEYVKEICIGYKNSSNLQKWKELISPFELVNNEIWHESNILEFHFIKSDIKEVQSITFKVRSLEKAKSYLLKNNIIWNNLNNKIELDRKEAFGLSMYLTQID